MSIPLIVRRKQQKGRDLSDPDGRSPCTRMPRRTQHLRGFAKEVHGVRRPRQRGSPGQASGSSGRHRPSISRTAPASGLGVIGRHQAARAGWAISGMPPTRLATNGVPHAAASSRTVGTPSERLGRTNTVGRPVPVGQLVVRPGPSSATRPCKPYAGDLPFQAPSGAAPARSGRQVKGTPSPDQSEQARTRTSSPLTGTRLPMKSRTGRRSPGPSRARASSPGPGENGRASTPS